MNDLIDRDALHHQIDREIQIAEGDCSAEGLATARELIDKAPAATQAGAADIYMVSEFVTYWRRRALHSELDIAAINRLHYRRDNEPVGYPTGYCGCDGYEWPCDTMRAIGWTATTWPKLEEVAEDAPSDGEWLV